MLITVWKPDDPIPWEKQQAEILAFVQKHGRRTIPVASYRALMKLSRRDFLMPGSSLLLAIINTEDGPRIAGFSCVTKYGQGVCLVMVHPLYRGRGLGSRLLARQLAEMGRLTCLVSIANVSCLQMCFRAGLSACRLVKERTGQAKLILEMKQGGGLEPAVPLDMNSAVNSSQGR